MVQTEEIRQKIQVLMNFFNAKRYDEVINKVKPLLRKNPNEVIFHNLLALSLQGSGKTHEGIEILNNALNKFPNNIFILNNLGLLNTSDSNYEKAEKYFKKILKIKDNFFDALINYSTLKLNINQGSEAIKILKKIKIKSENQYISTLDEISKLNLYFAIGKAKEDIKKYSESYDYIKKGNDIKNNLINYDFSHDLKISENSKKLFTNPYEVPNNKKTENKYIFIIGMPRSGTTLIEQILSSHDKVYGAGELDFITNIINKFFMEKDFGFKNDNIDDFDEELINDARAYYKKNTELFNYKEQFLTDKAPLNFRWVGFIFKLFPGSKIINCKRDTMDICWSNYKNLFTSNKMNYCYDFKNLSSFTKMYLDLMNFWNGKYQNKIFNIDYEALVNNPEYEVRKLLEYCELEWDTKCLNFYKQKNIVSTASVAQVRNPIYKSSVKSWENHSENLENLKNLIDN